MLKKTSIKLEFLTVYFISTEAMGKRLILFLCLLASTTAEYETKNQCHACIHGVCYGFNHPVEGNRFHVDNFDIDNLMYFVYPYSNEINSLNLIDGTVNTVVTADHTILGIAINGTSRDLYYSLDNGDFFKHNLLTNQTVSILKPTDESNRKRPGYINFFISSNKLYGTTNAFSTSGTFSYTNLFEYVPEELQFKDLVNSFKCEQLYDEPMGDNSSHVYYQRSRQLYTVPAAGNETILVHDSYYTPAAKSVAHVGSYVDNYGGNGFLKPDIRRLFKLDHITHEMVEAGAIEMPLRFDSHDIHKDLAYVYSRTSFATANNHRCVVKRFGINGVKIEKLPKSNNE